MGDKMYTVDRIEDNIVVLEDRISKTIINVDINVFDFEFKENDIIDYIEDKYIKNTRLTDNTNKNIRSLFNKLKK